MTIGSDQLDEWGKTLRTCSIDGCERKRVARRLCNLHWRRWRTHGNPNEGERHYRTAEESFAARTERRGECLIWTGGRNNVGYGGIRVKGRSIVAHRYAWERVNGPVPLGMELDHKCWNRACCEVSHLRLATRAENMGNRSGANSNSISGVRGVYKTPYGTYTARVDRDGKRYTSQHATQEAAIAWLEAKTAALYGDFRGRLVNPKEELNGITRPA